VYHSAKPGAPVGSLALSPSRTYPERSQGAFAQKLALDLGLIKNSNEDALGPLTGVGIQPSGGWQVSELLVPEIVDEVVTAARRAADSRRLPLSADGVEAVVQQAAAAILPPPPVEEARQEPVAQGEPQVIIQQLPPQVIIESESVRDFYDPYIFVPAPVVIDPHHPHHPHHDRRPDGRHDGKPSRFKSAPPSRQLPVAPHSPTHMPFGASHMPFGASHMPFGSSPSPSGSGHSGGSSFRR
jgi:hypothetical protein